MPTSAYSSPEPESSFVGRDVCRGLISMQAEAAGAGGSDFLLLRCEGRERWAKQRR